MIITPPGRAPFKLGVQDRNIPIGSVLDTTHGRVDLRAAPSPGNAHAARVQDAEFYKGKLTCAKFWMERLIPECPMLLERIQAGSETVMEFE